MATIELGVFGCPADPAVIDSYAEMGFTRCVIGVPPTGEDDALQRSTAPPTSSTATLD